MKNYIFFVLLISFFSCGDKIPTKNTTTKFIINPGTWTMSFDITCEKYPIDKIDVRFEVDSFQNITFINHTEKIKINDVRINNDSISFAPPQFNSEFIGQINSNTTISGLWYNNYKDDYNIPFVATHISEKFNINSDCDNTTKSKYDVTFSKGVSGDEYKAIGVFNTCANESNYCYGTFLTETGDYRFLEGKNENNKLLLSCFDGSHLFTFTGDIQGDSIVNGTFNSGKHWYEPWIAKLNTEASLSDPNTLTYLKDGYETIDITVQNLNGDSIYFNEDFYKGKVSIITIMGTWCPNCLDESRYFTDLFMKYHSKGLNILPVAFEPAEDINESIKILKRYFGRHHIPFQPYYGGMSKKSAASEKFHMLNKIMSYPTSIFIDKKGKVRKIHTGFYGPGTGEYYSDYMKETDKFVRGLLAE